jgi:hypothetical protein
MICAKTTVGTGRATLIILRNDRLGCEKGVIPETLACFNEEGGSCRRAQRRERIILLPGSFKGITSFSQFPLNIPRLPRNTQLVFYSLVVGFQVGVCERPINKIYC